MATAPSTAACRTERAVKIDASGAMKGPKSKPIACVWAQRKVTQTWYLIVARPLSLPPRRPAVLRTNIIRVAVGDVSKRQARVPWDLRDDFGGITPLRTDNRRATIAPDLSRKDPLHDRARLAEIHPAHVALLQRGHHLSHVLHASRTDVLHHAFDCGFCF
jgi:hypothetical protein